MATAAKRPRAVATPSDFNCPCGGPRTRVVGTGTVKITVRDRQARVMENIEDLPRGRSCM